MLANGADEANGDFTASYELVDVFTDDNNNNNSPTSSGGVLYDWDSSIPACELVGNHGANAAISCTELNSFFDEMGPLGSAQDAIADKGIRINLSGIDVRDPDNDSNLFEFRLNLWFDGTTEVANHQDCNGAAVSTCITNVTNRVGVLNTNSSALGPFDETNDNRIVSTEDASGNNLNNYNADEESFPNDVTYPLRYTTPAAGVAIRGYKSFTDHSAAKVPNEQFMAPGETRPFILNGQVLGTKRASADVDGSTLTLCDKIDTEVFEYAGLAPPNQDPNPPIQLFNTDRDYNPLLLLYTGDSAELNGSDYVTFYYSNRAHTPPNPTQADYLEALRSNTCDDDLNSDTVVNILDKNGNESNPGNPIDWYENPDDVPGGMAEITLVRQDMRIDLEYAREVAPNHANMYFAVNHLITAKSITQSPYGANNRLPNFASSRHDKVNRGNWLHAPQTLTDPSNDQNFSTTLTLADRMTLVPSSHEISKYTAPRNKHIVRAGETVDFIVEPQVHGLWSNTLNTASVTDSLPNETAYVLGSEQFSLDGGNSWLNRADYDASNPAITITSSINTNNGTELTWEFGSVDSGEQLPLIKYGIEVSDDVVAGRFINTAELDSGAIGNNEVARAKYRLQVLPVNGIEIFKVVDEPIYPINTSFSYKLNYKNLGAQDFSTGEFIDILPFNGDGSGTTGGLASSRNPPTRFSGGYAITDISSSNNEVFYATNASPNSLLQDICHEDNQVAGYVPVIGDTCYQSYKNNGDTFAGGASAGTGAITWVACADTTCSNVANPTAIRFTTGVIPSDEKAKTITLELMPSANNGGEPALDSSGNVTAASRGDIYTNNFSGRVPEISLQFISNDTSVTIVSGSIGDYVWLDANADGAQDASETPIEGVKLALLNASGDPIYVDSEGNIVAAGTAGAQEYTTETDTNGQYLFANLPVGDYQVKVVELPAGIPSLKQTYDSDGLSTENVSAVSLALELDPITGAVIGLDDNVDQDFGYQQLCTIGDTIYFDKDNDGVADTGEGLAGINVSLEDGAGNPIYVDTDGNIVAVGTPGATPLTAITDSEGKYLFEYLPAGDYTIIVDETTLPTALQGHNSQDPDSVKDSSSTITLKAGETNLEQDFGYIATMNVGNYVFIDSNANGVQDASDMPLAGAVVTLYEVDGITPAKDFDGDTVLPVTTGSDGLYSFDNLLPGDYVISVDAPDGYVATISVVDPNDNNDSDSNGATEENISTSGPISLISESEPATDGDGTNGNQTIDFGFVLLAVIGDTIYNDLDGNGVKDANEPGIAGVTVNLSNGDTATTNADGKYLFVNLPAGDYTITVITGSGTPLDGFTNTADPDTTLDSITTVTLSTGEVNLDQDFGYQSPLQAADNTYTTTIDNTVLINPLDGDTPGTTITAINGVTLTGSEQTIPVNNGTVLIDANGIISFKPETGFTGEVRFPYVISDGFSTATGNVTITISPSAEPEKAIQIPSTSSWSLILALLAISSLVVNRRHLRQ